MQDLRVIKLFLKSDFGIALCIALLWQLAFSLIGWFLAPEQGPLGHMSHWDAGWYRHIIEHWYSNEGSPAAPAFYPLFPLLTGTLSTLSFGIFSYELLALLVNTIALWFSMAALLRITQKIGIQPSGSIASIAVFLCFPSAFFMHVFYGEAVFIALALWAYAFALERKWWAVGALLAFITAARLPSLLFVLLCGLEYLRAYNWGIKKALNRNILWFLLAPIGFIAYGLYLYLVRGDFLAMFHAYSATNDWTYQQFSLNIFKPIWDSLIIGVPGLFQNGGYTHFINELLPFISVLAIIVCSIYVLIRLKSKGIPLFVFGIVSVILFSLNSNLVSVHRYALACIVIFIAAGLFYKKGIKEITLYSLCAVSIIVQLFLFAKFVANIFAG